MMPLHFVPTALKNDLENSNPVSVLKRRFHQDRSYNGLAVAFTTTRVHHTHYFENLGQAEVEAFWTDTIYKHFIPNGI